MRSPLRGEAGQVVLQERPILLHRTVRLQDELLLLGQADHFGRLTEDALKRDYPAGTWLRERAQKLDVEDSKPAPLISGKDLIEQGFQEGKTLGDLLKQCYVMQLNGELKTKQDAIDFIKKSQLPHEK